MPKRIARWNPARDVWETETTGLFCEHSDVFSETWPTSGMTRSGVAYELPTSAPLMDGSACSSLLPTPSLSMADRGGAEPESRAGHTLNLQDVAEYLLLTPMTRDHKRANQRQDDTCLHGALIPANTTALGVETSSASTTTRDTPALLPTPTATPYGSNQSASAGAAVRPSLDTLAPTLLPTPTAKDSAGSRGHRLDGTPYGPTSGTTLTDATLSLGDSTNPRSAAGNEPSGE